MEDRTNAKNLNQERLEGKLVATDFSPLPPSPKTSTKDNIYYTVRLRVEETQEEISLYFWEERFNNEEKEIIQSLNDKDSIVVHGQRKTTPQGREIFQVWSLETEVEIFR